MRDPLTVYRFSVCVEAPGMAERVCRNFDVDPQLAHCLAPYDQCSDPVTARLVGGLDTSESAAVDALRKKLIDHISQQISAELMEALKLRDLRDGCPQKPT